VLSLEDAYMRSICVALCAAAVLLTTAAKRPTDNELFMQGKPAKDKHKRGQPTTLKGYALGMTLAAFKQRPVPPNVNGAVRVICSDDPAMQASLGRALAPKFEGETICGFQLLRSREWEPGGLALDATHDATAIFHFLRGSLVQIESQEDAALSDAVIQSLTTQYGQPRAVNKRTSQSITNEVRTQLIVTWVNGGDGIVVAAPSLGTNRMSVTYTNLEGFAAMQGGGANLR
jgi:hypothetical protein